VALEAGTGLEAEGYGQQRAEQIDSPASRSEGSSRGDLFVLCCGSVVRSAVICLSFVVVLLCGQTGGL
jgi:hypothetical protein